MYVFKICHKQNKSISQISFVFAYILSCLICFYANISSKLNEFLMGLCIKIFFKHTGFKNFLNFVCCSTESAFPEKYEKKNADSVLQHLYPFAKLLQTQAKSVNFFQIESIFGGFFLHLASARLVLRRRYRHWSTARATTRSATLTPMWLHTTMAAFEFLSVQKLLKTNLSFRYQLTCSWHQKKKPPIHEFKVLQNAWKPLKWKGKA